MDDEEDEPITIDHLVGTKCILNESIQVELRRNRGKGNRIELYTDGGLHFLLIGGVTDMTADGGFIVTITNQRGEILNDKGRLIPESLYKQESIKRRRN